VKKGLGLSVFSVVLPCLSLVNVGVAGSFVRIYDPSGAENVRHKPPQCVALHCPGDGCCGMRASEAFHDPIDSETGNSQQAD